MMVFSKITVSIGPSLLALGAVPISKRCWRFRFKISKVDKNHGIYMVFTCFRSLLAGYPHQFDIFEMAPNTSDVLLLRPFLSAAFSLQRLFSFILATWLSGLLQGRPGAVLVPLSEGQRHFSGALRGSMLALIHIDAAEEWPMGSEAAASRAGTSVEH